VRRLRRLLPTVSSAYLKYAYVALRSEADEFTTLSTAWAWLRSEVVRRLRRFLPPASSAYLKYAYVAVRSEADESTTLSTAWTRSTAQVLRRLLASVSSVYSRSVKSVAARIGSST
jgi:hypothetical protein